MQYRALSLRSEILQRATTSVTIICYWSSSRGLFHFFTFTFISISQSISDFLDWPKWPESLHGPLKCYRQKDCCSKNKTFFKWRPKDCNVGAETMCSGREFQIWAAATGKARLPTVESLTGGTKYFKNCITFFLLLFLGDSIYEIDPLNLQQTICSSVLWYCWLDYLACKNRPRNDLLFVGCMDVKPYLLEVYFSNLLHSGHRPSGQLSGQGSPQYVLPSAMPEDWSWNKLLGCVFPKSHSNAANFL